MLGLLGLLFSLIPLIGVIAWPLVLMFAAIGLPYAREQRQPDPARRPRLRVSMPMPEQR